ncbi:MAG: alginate lyase family protein [Bacteroidetes bacterium]|nr:alginate lyase family protein [Bacteroidota bacterium]
MKLHTTITTGILLFAVATACSQSEQQRGSIQDAVVEVIVEAERQRVIESADAFLAAEPVTVTASSSERSAGGLHDYFSEGTYWWPDPDNPGGPYIRRDGIVNPDNFVDHLDAMKRLSTISGTLTAAYLLTGDQRYAEHAMRHLNAWFVNPDTKMNPHLRYAQAITGRVTGRGIGIIDTVHLIDVAQAANILAQSPYVSQFDIEAIKTWFNAYTVWLKTHPYGIEEMNWRNNHGTWWHAQVAAFASLTGDEESLEFVRERTKSILIPNQMSDDGSFHYELERTRPYAYSFFNINGMVLLAHILEIEGLGIWDFELEDGRGMKKAVDFIHHYTRHKEEWPFEPDVDYWDELPGQQPFLLLSAMAYDDMEYLTTWQNVPEVPLSHEGLRNLVLKNIILWVGLPNPA